MKKSVIAFICILMLSFLMTGSAWAAKNGWSGNYYYKDGKKLTGVQQIGKKTYCFTSKGVLVKSKSPYRAKVDGEYHYYEIGKKGVATEWTGMAALAAQQLYALKANLSNPTSASREKALLKAFLWSADLKYFANGSIDKSKKGAEKYARQAFVNHSGDCVTKAYGFYWMAKVLGYSTAKVVYGYVPNSYVNGVYGDFSEYAWVTIKIGGKTYVFDPTLNTKTVSGKSSRKLYGKRYAFKFTYGTTRTYKYHNAKRKLIK